MTNSNLVIIKKKGGRKMVEYIEAIKKPFSDLKTLGIGSIIAAIPLVNLLVNGYGAATAQDVLKKKNKLREWKLNDLKDYIIKLLIVLVIQITYVIIPIIIILAGVGTAIATALPTILNSAGDPTAIVNSLMPSIIAGGPIILIGGLLLLVSAFLAPIATMKWIKKDKLGAAFEIGKVVKNALTIDYILSLIVIFGYTIILGLLVGIITGILALIPVIGWVLAWIITGGMTFALTTTQFTILAQVVKD